MAVNQSEAKRSKKTASRSALHRNHFTLSIGIGTKKPASSTPLHILLLVMPNMKDYGKPVLISLRLIFWYFSGFLSVFVNFHLLAFLVFSFHVLCVCFIFCLSAWCIRRKRPAATQPSLPHRLIRPI